LGNTKTSGKGRAGRKKRILSDQKKGRRSRERASKIRRGETGTEDEGKKKKETFQKQERELLIRLNQQFQNPKTDVKKGGKSRGGEVPRQEKYKVKGEPFPLKILVAWNQKKKNRMQIKWGEGKKGDRDSGKKHRI